MVQADLEYFQSVKYTGLYAFVFFSTHQTYAHKLGWDWMGCDNDIIGQVQVMHLPQLQCTSIFNMFKSSQLD